MSQLILANLAQRKRLTGMKQRKRVKNASFLLLFGIPQFFLASLVQRKRLTGMLH
jgi:hypothetical protein